MLGRRRAAALLATGAALAGAPAAHAWNLTINSTAVQMQALGSDPITATFLSPLVGPCTAPAGITFSMAPSNSASQSTGNCSISGVNGNWSVGTPATLALTGSAGTNSHVTVVNHAGSSGSPVPIQRIDVGLGDGNDYFAIDGSAQGVFVTEANDPQFNSGNDVYDVSALADVTTCNLTLGAGDDTAILGTQPCAVDGGPGNDVAQYSAALGGINVQFTGPSTAVTGSGGSLTAVEEVDGGPGNDFLTGSAGTQILNGEGGDDQISGGADVDQMFGGDGNDTLESRDGVAETVDCGPGDDTAVVEAIDTTIGCEHVELPPPPPGPPTPIATGGSGSSGTSGGSTATGAGHSISSATPKAKKKKVGHVKATVSAQFLTGFTGSRVTTMMVRALPTKSTIQLRCTPPESPRGTGPVTGACPFTTLTLRNTKANGKRSVVSAFRHRLLPVGTLLEIRIRRTGDVGRSVRYTVRRGRAPVRTTTCLNSKKGTAQKC